MGALLKGRNGWLVVRIMSDGKRWQERTGRRDTAENRQKLARFIRALDAEVKTGPLTPARYLYFFPHGNRAPAMRQLEGLRVDPDQTPTLDAYALGWIERQRGKVRPATFKNYRLHLAKVCAAQVGDIRVGALPIACITPAQLESIRSQWMSAPPKPLTLKTCSNILRGSLGALYRDAQRIDRLVTESPVKMLDWPRKAMRDPDPFTAEERDLILTKVADRWYAPLLRTLFWTGLRVSEAFGLQWGDVDLLKGRLYIRRSLVDGSLGDPKTPESRRTVRVAPEVVDLLRALKPLHADQDTYVFTMPSGRAINQRRFTPKQWRDAERVANVRPRRLYDTRSTFISLALGAGVDIAWLAKQCGTSVAIIERHYARWLPDAEAAQLMRLSETISSRRGESGAIAVHGGGNG